MIELILREDVPPLGRSGDVVKVRDGYARNYLLPKGLAYPATEGNKRRIEREAQALAKRHEAEQAEAQAMAERLDGVQLTFRMKVGEEDQLFGSVTAVDVQRALEGQGVSIEKRKIELHEPLRELGNFDVPIRLHAQVQPTVRVILVQE
jgi:large subunit ribosomal protein L9